MKFLYLVWSNLKRKKLRTSLTLLSILVAFVLYSLLSALKLALGGGVNMADANRLVVRHRVSFIQPLPHSYQTRIATIPGVSAAERKSPDSGRLRRMRNHDDAVGHDSVIAGVRAIPLQHRELGQMQIAALAVAEHPRELEYRNGSNGRSATACR